MSTKRNRKEKPTMTPTAYMDHDKKFYYVEVELPGVKKQDIDLSVSDRVSVFARRGKTSSS